MSCKLARFCSKWFASHAATIAPSGTVSFITTSSQNWTSRLAFTSARLSPLLFSAVMRGRYWQLMLMVAAPFSAATFATLPLGQLTV